MTKPSKTSDEIFKKGSKTYYYSSFFFPDAVKSKVSDLYAFVRVADDFVDSVPQDAEGFYDFKVQYQAAIKSGVSENEIIQRYLKVEAESKFEPEWSQAFLKSMEMDLTKKRYKTLDEVEEYIYGSAEVIGLFMNRILGISSESDKYAKYLGKAMQYINFIRDIAEDLEFDRIYMPEENLKSFGLTHKDFTVKKLTGTRKDQFNEFIRSQIAIFNEWQQEAEKGFAYIPKRYLIPIKTASEMYKYTAWRIRRNPQIIFDRKVKPSRKRIFGRAILEAITPRTNKTINT